MEQDGPVILRSALANDEENGDWAMRNPEILTNNKFAARITESHCESAVPDLHGPGFTAKEAYWPLCQVFASWLGSQVFMIDVDDAHRTTRSRGSGLRKCSVSEDCGYRSRMTRARTGAR